MLIDAPGNSGCLWSCRRKCSRIGTHYVKRSASLWSYRGNRTLVPGTRLAHAKATCAFVASLSLDCSAICCPLSLDCIATAMALMPMMAWWGPSGNSVQALACRVSICHKKKQVLIKRIWSFCQWWLGGDQFCSGTSWQTLLLSQRAGSAFVKDLAGPLENF